MNKSSDDDATNIFHIFGSTEYNLWVESDFHEAVKALVGLIMYLMSGKAQCGPLEATFNNLLSATNRDDRQRHRNSYEEIHARVDKTGHGDDQKIESDMFEEEVEERLALTRVEANDQKKESKRENKRHKRKEKLLLTRQKGHGSTGHRIASFGWFRKAWWKWVWRGRD